MKRLGLKVEPVSRQRLLGIKPLDKLNHRPTNRLEVTTPVRGTVTRLLVQPGDQVSAGQAAAIMTSPELAELRTTALDRRAPIGSTQQAQADLRLAQRPLLNNRKLQRRTLLAAGHK